jgi:Glucosamine 6-phosphate synthetase, contains amidotransferase and phosphosugar isomerase domains
MCGIVGYIGGRNVKDVLINGMRSLEYRGYDSAGVAIMDAPELHIVKGVGKVADLEKILEDHPVSRKPGHRPHQVGHPWRSHGNERSSPFRPLFEPRARP